MKKCRFLVLLLLAFVGLAACSSQKKQYRDWFFKIECCCNQLDYCGYYKEYRWR